VSFSIVDGGIGDDDLTANGSVVDPGGPGVSQNAAATMEPIPTLDPRVLVMLVVVMLGAGMRAVRR
jgi:hypothetical protein